MSSSTTRSACRACATPLSVTFVDLGETPLANSYLDAASSPADEARYPLRAVLCTSCMLVQLDHDVSPDAMFSDYAYFSSYSESWLQHASAFAQQAVDRWSLGPESLVVEVASNDGYLLQNFVTAGIPVLGIEPAQNVAETARAAGVETVAEFFTTRYADQMVKAGTRADLLVGNNVFAHVPDTLDFARALQMVVRPGGVVSLEFPHFLHLLEGVQFDTIYHEHFSYFSLIAAENVLRAAGLRVFEVEELRTHGGSLRVLAERADSPDLRAEGEGLQRVRAAELAAGLDDEATYAGFAKRVDACRASLRAMLDRARAAGRAVVGYGAAAKGNTLLNYCGVTDADIAYVVDRSPHKQGRLLPGSRIPVRAPEVIATTQPDYVLILPWNLRDEIVEQMSFVRDWGGRFVVPLPEVEIVA